MPNGKNMGKTKKIVFVFLSLVCLLASFLYFYKLNSVPSSIYADESTVGYNAYSILETGKDEYGKPAPLAFRLFGAYTPPLFVYLLVPFIKFLGLTALSIRLPSAILSLAFVVLVYYFFKSLKLHKSFLTPVISSLIFATAPWVIFNARLGYEVTFGYILFYVGVFLIWQETQKKTVSLLGLFLVSMSTYVAHTERYLVPLFLLSFIIVFYKQIFTNKNKKLLLAGGLVILITQLPHFYLITTPAFWVKNTAFAATSWQVGLWDFVSQLLVYFSPHTYFGRSDADINYQHFIPEISLFYSWQIIPFFVGFIYLLKNIKHSGSKLIILLLVLSPLPGAMSGHFISIQRILPILLPIIFTITLGVDYFLFKFPSKTLISLSILFILSLVLLYRSYFIFLPSLRTIWWSYGAEDVAKFILENKNTKIIIDNSRDQALYSPIIFYLKYPPKDFQSQFESVRNVYYQNPKYNPVLNIGNTITRPIVWETDTIEEAYIIGDPLAISAEQAQEHYLLKIKNIVDSTGKVHFQIYQTQPAKKNTDNARKQ